MDILRRFPFGICLLRILAQIMRSPSYFEKCASEILDPLEGRHDLMHLMLTANEDSTEKRLSKPTDEDIIGQCQIVIAGYETSSNTLAYITYQLALNQNVRDRLREEIKEAIKRNPESSLYDLSHDIDYLDSMNESLRLNPPLAQQVNRK